MDSDRMTCPHINYSCGSDGFAKCNDCGQFLGSFPSGIPPGYFESMLKERIKLAREALAKIKGKK